MGLPYDCQWWVETAEAYGCPISFLFRYAIETQHTSNRKTRAARDKLQVGSSTRTIVRGHNFDQITDCTTVNVEPVIGLNGFIQGC